MYLHYEHIVLEKVRLNRTIYSNTVLMVAISFRPRAHGEVKYYRDNPRVILLVHTLESS
jgi:hypothetical protein